jgi:ABC-2 type transport system permease protein
MNRALWRRAFLESRMMLLASTALLFGFHWLFVWLSSKIDLGAMGMFLGALPKEWQRVSPVPVADLATPAGRIGLAYVDPVALVTVTAWGIARGSDAVSGELGRGTLEMVVAQPVRRISVLSVQAGVATLGAILLGVASWLGTCAGLATVTLPGDVQVARLLYVPAAWNLTSLSFFLAGFTTLLSSCDRYRWRSIGLAAGFYVVSLIMKLVARMAPEFEWLLYGSFLGFFEPLLFINHADDGFWLSLEYNGGLMGLGLLCYASAAAIFCHRDLPAPI